MNGAKYLVDTNCFIHFLDESPLLKPFINEGWAYSYITEIELLCKNRITDVQDDLIRKMLANCYKVNHSHVLTNMVITLKRNNKIKLPDALIAATAQLLHLPLITADKGFAKLKDVDCIILDF